MKPKVVVDKETEVKEKEEARKRMFAMAEEFKEACKDIPDEELEKAIDEAVKAVRAKKRALTKQQ